MSVTRPAEPGQKSLGAWRKFESKPTYVASRRGVGATARWLIKH